MGGWCNYESIRRPGRNVGAESRAESPRFGCRGSKTASSRGPVLSCLESISCRRAFAHGEDDAEVEPVRAGDAVIIALQL
jgi:hypothetical protein